LRIDVDPDTRRRLAVRIENAALNYRRLRGFTLLGAGSLSGLLTNPKRKRGLLLLALRAGEKARTDAA